MLQLPQLCGSVEKLAQYGVVGLGALAPGQAVSGEAHVSEQPPLVQKGCAELHWTLQPLGVPPAPIVPLPQLLMSVARFAQ
jgi:hypothetical protein